jgi:hypothetical protein
MRKLVLVSALAMLSSIPAVAADSPWNGTWKLDLAKSKFTGDTFTYSQGPDGKIHYSDGSVSNYDFGTDGKQYPTPYGDTIAIMPHGPNEWDSVSHFGDKEIARTHHVISPDGKTLTATSTGTRPDGSAFKDEVVYTRLSGTSGPMGKWRSTKVDLSAPSSFIVRSTAPSSFDWEIPDYKETVSGKADGSDIPIVGPTVPKNMALAVKLLSPRKVSYTVKMDGKPVSYGIQTLAADNKSFTDVSWSPGKESEKQTGIYVKQ